jgi:phosphoglycerate dehydrogenase-like enzyme
MKQRSIDTILINTDRVLRMFNNPHRFEEDVSKAVRKVAPEANLVILRGEEEWERRQAELSPRVEVSVGLRPATWFKEMPNLRWAQQIPTATNWLVDLPEFAQSDVILTNLSEARDIPIAEHVFALMLTLSRCIQRSVRRQIKHDWDKWNRVDMTELNGATIGIIGVGRVGAKIAERAKGMNMGVLGLRRHPERSVPHVDRMYGPEGLTELLSESDWVVISAALTSETKGMIGEHELKAMKKSAHIINVGRGPQIKEEVLIKALQEGWIAGAGLDVFEQEPLPVDSPLWDMENVVITPHHAASTPYLLDRFIEIFTENLRRYQAGEPLINVVEKRLGY